MRHNRHVARANPEPTQPSERIKAFDPSLNRVKRSPSLHRSSTLDATSCCQPLRSQPSSWLAWRRPHTMRELPTMEVRIPRLLGRTLLHWRRPPVEMPFQIKNKLSSHIGVALANHSQAIGRTSPECGCARSGCTVEAQTPPEMVALG